MRVTLDVGKLRGTIALWRHILEEPETRAGHRADVIANVWSTVGGWSDLLRLCSADDGDQAQLASVCAEVGQFHDWLLETKLAVALLADVRAQGGVLPHE